MKTEIKFLRWCISNRRKINSWTFLSALSLIGIDYTFISNQYPSNFQWAVCLVGGGVAWFVTFCIKDEVVMKEGA